jgi:hypothetical protein
MIDGTIVRAHQHSAGAPKADGNQAIGKSPGNTGKTPGEDALFPCPGSGKPDSSYV